MKLRLLVGLVAGLLALPATASTTLKSGQVLDGLQPGTTTTVDQAYTKSCADGTVVAPTADCPKIVVNVGGSKTSIDATTSTNGVFKFAAGAHVGDNFGGFAVHHAYRTVETPTGVTLDGVTIHDFDVDDVQRGFARIRANHNVTFRDITAKFRAAPQTSMTNLPACIQEEGEQNTGGLLIQNVSCDGFQLTMSATSYWNGDGLNLDSQNLGCGVKLINVRMTNNTDSGFDIKCGNLYGDLLYSAGNKRNYRFWHGGTFGRVECGDTTKRGGTSGPACVWTNGSTKYPLHIGLLVVNFTKTDAPIIKAEGLIDLVVDACELHVPAGTVLLSGSVRSKSFGPGCTVQ